jgi:hypothetical protein
VGPRAGLDAETYGAAHTSETLPQLRRNWKESWKLNLEATRHVSFQLSSRHVVQLTVEKKNEDPFVRKTTEQLTRFPLCARIQEVTAFPAAEVDLQFPVSLLYTRPNSFVFG